jgi:hypothetical protein
MNAWEQISHGAGLVEVRRFFCHGGFMIRSAQPEDARPITEAEGSLELGTWMGRRQAFGIVSGKCSAADVECLRVIRDQKMYRSMGLDWREFCERHTGISKRYADQLIRQLEDLGPAYFRLCEVMRISPKSFRLIAGAVSEGAVEYQGESIPIRPENVVRLREAIQEMQKQAGSEQARAEAPQKRLSLDSTERQFERCLDAIEARLDEKPDLAECQRIHRLLSAGASRLVALSRTLSVLAA